ncbi:MULTISPECIES: hypothetical protein [Haloferax]|uniref:Uncharacterized protein n=1 Tax=Haloferax marinum TaxID=2666143 RepID=A0A6A8GBS8_9EURY|nr:MULTISPECIES: hypothetical protein [Haloferax]KAB1191134.1 hypothetical protein Hfx1150_15740 [Haloferax sp. CBA1150]MRW98018.1 hypothetical protein [Haloferax marinum]
MNARQVGFVLVATVLIVGLAGGALVLGQQTLASHSHTYVYRVAVDTESNLTDVTIYAPLPVNDGETLFESYDGVTVVRTPQEVWVPEPDPRAPSDTGGDADWSVAVVETEDGPMLALRATTVEAGTYVFGADTQYEPGRVQTADPWDSAFVLHPAGDVSEDRCAYRYREDDIERCYTHDTRLYADYDASTDASVIVDVSLHGRSEWTFAMANGWNWFDQQTAVTFDDERTGWVVAEGSLHGGAGTYP